ncbi:MAG: hypothetical protein HY332_08175 [Chloroflexi bacterium]|nr:hypothetical protein [Chloroflexota bacterium]
MRTIVALLAAVALLPMAAPSAALAHERRPVGPYTFVVGFISEPALLGEPNGISLSITKTADGSPAEGAHQTLRAQVAFGGGQPKEFPLRARFGMPGAYTADLIPTKAGSYIFTFTGTIDGTPVNEKFESGPGRFNDVQDTATLQFPEAVPAAAQMASSVKAAQDQAQAAQARADDAEAQVGQARLLGIVGIVAGLLGVAVGASALVVARRPAGTAPRPTLAEHSVVRG